MNWLAHVFLSEPSIHEQLGNLLTDPLKGKSWDGMNVETRFGMAVHLQIDGFTDSHEIFLGSCQRLGNGGRLRSVVADLVYDHMLSCNWHYFSDEPLIEFLNRFYQRTEEVIEPYPDKAQEFISAIIKSHRLGRYGTLACVEDSMTWIDKRLSDRVIARERTQDYMDKIENEYAGLRADFMEFFPKLQSHVYPIQKQRRDTLESGIQFA